LYLRFHDLTRGEQGQDLVEYALLLSLICLALITGINGIAKAANTVFSNISSSLA
jgi:Flp pilus assembly pilin Flp